MPRRFSVLLVFDGKDLSLPPDWQGGRVCFAYANDLANSPSAGGFFFGDGFRRGSFCPGDSSIAL
jgi:hypothetical protein